MMCRLVFLLFSILVGVPFLCAQGHTPDYSEAIKLIEVWLDAQRDYDNLPGISLAVVQDQEVIWAGGFGVANPEQNVEADANTICSICSISKLFTSVAIMKLYDEGKLRLDDEVSDLLPWYDLEQQYHASGPVTVRGLLTHSSGLPREANFAYWTGPDFPFPTTEQIKAELSNQQTLYPSAQNFQYSNLGMSLLGEIVAEVSGQSYDNYVQENILTPLGLADTRTELPEDLYGSQLAIGYTAIKRDATRDKVNLFQANGIKAAAGFSSTVLDLSKFAQWQMRLIDTTVMEILQPSTLKNMYNVHWTDPDFETTWGLGFSVFKGSDGQKWVGHGGSCPGYRSSLQLNPKTGRAYAAMINSSGTNPGKYIRGVHGILGKIEAKDDDEEDKPDLSEYVGYYNASPWWSEEYIGTSNGQLVMLGLPSNNPAESMTMLKHIEGDTFRRIRDDGELGEAVEFARDADGKITGYYQHNTFTPRWEKS